MIDSLRIELEEYKADIEIMNAKVRNPNEKIF